MNQIRQLDTQTHFTWPLDDEAAETDAWQVERCGPSDQH